MEEFSEWPNRTSLALIEQPKLESIDSEIIALIMEEIKEKGLLVGASIVSKKVPGVARQFPSNWGIVVKHNEYLQKGARYKPLVIQWLNGSRQEVDIEEIILVNTAPSPSYLKEIAHVPIDI